MWTDDRRDRRRVSQLEKSRDIQRKADESARECAEASVELAGLWEEPRGTREHLHRVVSVTVKTVWVELMATFGDSLTELEVMQVVDRALREQRVESREARRELRLTASGASGEGGGGYSGAGEVPAER